MLVALGAWIARSCRGRPAYRSPANRATAVTTRAGLSHHACQPCPPAYGLPRDSSLKNPRSSDMELEQKPDPVPHRARPLLQLRHPLSTWDEKRSPSNPVFPGQRAYPSNSTIVELRGLEPLTLTLPGPRRAMIRRLPGRRRCCPGAAARSNVAPVAVTVAVSVPTPTSVPTNNLTGF